MEISLWVDKLTDAIPNSHENQRSTAQKESRKDKVNTPTNSYFKRISTTCKRGSRSIEHVHWTRYQRVDLKMSWDDIMAAFPIQFSESAPKRYTVQEDYYKDNDIVEIDEDGNAVFDAAGRQLWIKINALQKDREDVNDAPFSFLERLPWQALRYNWVSPEHKTMAADIVADIEKKDPSEHTR